MRELSSEHAKYALSGLGLTVRDIETVQDEKRADIYAQYMTEDYIIEAKERYPHERWTELRKFLKPGELRSMTRTINPWNALSTTVKEACRQLDATPASETVFRVLWIVVPHDDYKFVISCYKKLFFGRARLSVLNRDFTHASVMDCYNYYPNEFEKYTRLDGVILGNIESAQLLVNFISSRKDDFRKSYLYSALNQHNAVIDPEIMEANGKCFIIPAVSDGEKVKSKREYLQQNYNVLTSVMMESQFTGIFSIQ
jgi:hypothetical protein